MKFLPKLLLAVMLLTTVFCSFQAKAENDLVDDMLIKLGRGVANVAFGPLEILIRPYDVQQEKGAVPALTYGVLKGAVFVVAREVVGVVDIITFPFPLPGCTEDQLDVGWGYGPIIRPAWVVDREHNAFNFFFQDTSIATGN
ncbi:exosortase system-associated protein, TIGR04073 family [Victivallis sp. Marseille-Q1083]|uniref:exosortase system-associated protein, TIGR04073 family n=1 Tax=Victivallis sp. Marseille-Q1083 TaxID=2717288 RepID=UPI00158B880D|nr:exosortase system-associated protein, TIGR04073 family [Victivallis sp. Marseille-Q1083]